MIWLPFVILVHETAVFSSLWSYFQCFPNIRAQHNSYTLLNLLFLWEPLISFRVLEGLMNCFCQSALPLSRPFTPFSLKNSIWHYQSEEWRERGKGKRMKGKLGNLFLVALVSSWSHKLYFSIPWSCFWKATACQEAAYSLLFYLCKEH